MGVAEAAITGALIGLLAAGGVAGFANCKLYQDWQEEHKPEVYTFGSVDGITTSDAAPEIEMEVTI